MPDLSTTTSVRTAGNTQLLADIDSGSGQGSLVVKTAAGVVLGTVTLTDPAGTIDGSGFLTLTASNASVGVADGEASYIEVQDSDGNVHMTIPCVAGESAVSGFAALNSLTIVAGEPLRLAEFTVG